MYHSTGDGIWRSLETAVDGTGSSIWGANANNVYVVVDGDVLFSNGNGAFELSLESGKLEGVGGLNEHTVYACGDKGLFYRSNGRGTWSEQERFYNDPEFAYHCRAIWVAETGEVYFGGSGIFKGTPQ